MLYIIICKILFEDDLTSLLRVEMRSDRVRNEEDYKGQERRRWIMGH